MATTVTHGFLAYAHIDRGYYILASAASFLNLVILGWLLFISLPLTAKALLGLHAAIEAVLRALESAFYTALKMLKKRRG